MPDEMPNGAPATPSEPTTSTPNTLSQEPKRGVPVWVWVLIGIGALAFVGGAIALAFVLMQPKPQPMPLNSTTTSTSNAANTSNEVSNVANAIEEDGDDTVSFLEGTAEIIDAVGASLENWSTAADLGAEGDFDGSTAALEEGLDAVEDAEAMLDDLTPTAATAALYDLLVEAVAKARLAMEKGIEGNETDNIDAIDESGQAVEDLSGILDEITVELDNISADAEESESDAV